ncbi:MAG: hypothetical protein QOI36_5590, partial [Pseudonocardiales bacterium]|nr:hypothetical protein [Pseudonocardiales bacterium]
VWTSIEHHRTDRRSGQHLLRAHRRPVDQRPRHRRNQVTETARLGGQLSDRDGYTCTVSNLDRMSPRSWVGEPPRFRIPDPIRFGPERRMINAVERGDGRKPLVARYGGIPLRWQKKAVLEDRQPGGAVGPKELITRFLAGGGARSASDRRTCRFTTSESSRISTGSVSRKRWRGQRSWQNGAAKPLWFARTVMTTSISDSNSRNVRSREPDAFNGARPVRWGATRERGCILGQTV